MIYQYSCLRSVLSIRNWKLGTECTCLRRIFLVLSKVSPFGPLALVPCHLIKVCIDPSFEIFTKIYLSSRTLLSCESFFQFLPSISWSGIDLSHETGTCLNIRFNYSVVFRLGIITWLIAFRLSLILGKYWWRWLLTEVHCSHGFSSLINWASLQLLPWCILTSRRLG